MLELIRDNLESIADICRRHGVKRLELFGSAARGDFNPAKSDIDFFVEFNDYADPAIADHWFELQEDLAKLLGHQVDICSLRTATDPLFLDVANCYRVGYMLPESRKRLSDMLRYAQLIGKFIAGKSFDDFKSDDLLRAGVYYEFLIMGEALSVLRVSERSIAEQITEYDRIIGFRNQLIHGFQKIDDEITWRIIEQKVPVLARDLERLLA